MIPDLVASLNDFKTKMEFRNAFLEGKGAKRLGANYRLILEEQLFYLG